MIKIILASIFTVVCSVFSAVAQDNRPDLEAYGQMPLISSASISPDGSKVATIANAMDGSRLIVFDYGGEVIKQVGIANMKARGVSFFGNNHVILNVSDTTKTRGFKGEYEFSGSFAVSLQDDKIIALLKGTKGIFPAQSGLGDIVGRGPKSGEILMPAYMGAATSTPSFDLLKVSLKNGRGRIHQRGSQHVRDWFTDGNGEALVREEYNNRADTYRIRYRTGGKWQVLYEEEDAPIPPLSIYGVMPDDSGLVFVAATEENDGFDELLKLGFDGSVSEPLLVEERKEIDFIYTDGDRRVIGVRYSGAEPTYGFIDEKIAVAHAMVTERLPHATLYLNSWSDDRSRLLYKMFEASIGDVWLLADAKTGALGILVNNRGSIPVDQIGTVSAITYPARDGLTIPGIMTTPPGVSLEDDPKLPLIVLPHGGPAAYDRMDFDWMAQYFANRGYLVLQPNFRGSTGYGLAFKNAGRV